MNAVEARLEGLQAIKHEAESLGLLVDGGKSLREDTGFELSITSIGEDTEEKIKKLKDYGDFTFEGYALDKSGENYTVFYGEKSEARKLKDELLAHLLNMGFTVYEQRETSPNLGFIFTVKTESPDLLKKLKNFKTLIFDGYTFEGSTDSYEVVYIFPKDN